MSDFPGYPRQVIDQGAALEWVRAELPKAIAWAEADLLATRRIRKYWADQAVKTGRCAVGHLWRDRGLDPEGPLCGYCVNAAEHERLWVPPVSAPRMPDHLAPPAPTADGRKVWL